MLFLLFINVKLKVFVLVKFCVIKAFSALLRSNEVTTANLDFSIDATMDDGSPGRLINHSRGEGANLIRRVVFSGGESRVVFVALRMVNQYFLNKMTYQRIAVYYIVSIMVFFEVSAPY